DSRQFGELRMNGQSFAAQKLGWPIGRHGRLACVKNCDEAKSLWPKGVRFGTNATGQRAPRWASPILVGICTSYSSRFFQLAGRRSRPTKMQLPERSFAMCTRKLRRSRASMSTYFGLIAGRSHGATTTAA